ncbi:cilia- and flagella-associated protein 54 isoform X4 [Mobula birostris]|uniref:cilia- and flagella-associated protein 54 isoform X4 n=1 Tax=Mobula birostris TaxID=1983395 RepID=UPI003B2829FE
MEPLPAAAYGKLDQKNPVVLALEQELNDFKNTMAKAVSADTFTRGANDLFCIWNKYEKMLPVHYFEEKLLMVGDFLVHLKQYNLAACQCYGRYLQKFGSFRMDDITDIEKFKVMFFVNGLEVDNSSFTFHALQMYSVCCYQMVKKVDLKLLNLESRKKCRSILNFLRLIMQVALPKEHLFWIIFNGTTYIYTICRHLMVLAFYAQAFEYVLWASISMESSAPLLTVRYLSWRATLYTAVCQCYYDCDSGILGETFARRALGKISELNRLEIMSSSPPSPETTKIFREATIKVSVMIFKRAVFESRRKPKGILRPKLKTNYRDTHNQPWPHNPTEFLLVEMFNGSAAQFLAISEALSGGNRRVLQTKPPVPAEQEVLDVTMELFLAGLLLISGGGGNTHLNSSDPVGGVKRTSSLMELAANGEDGVSIEATVRFAKAAFCFEYLDIFDTIIAPLLTFLRKHNNLAWKSFELDLDLLVAMEPFVSSRKSKHGLPIGENCAIGGLLHPGAATNLCDDLVVLAETMFVYTCTPFQGNGPDIDMVVDALLFLWQRCKAVLQRDICKASGSIKYLKKIDGFEKWIHILYILHEVAHWCNIGHVDPVLMVDIVLYSAGALENLADSSMKSEKKSGILADRSDTAMSTQTPTSIQTEFCSPTNLLMKHASDQLVIASKMLEKAMDNIAAARSAAVSPDGSLLIDNNLLNELTQKAAYESDPQKQEEIQKGDSYGARTMQSLIMDLHLELFQVYYRVAFKLLKINLDLLNSKSGGQGTSSTGSTEADIIKKVKKNKVLKALFLIQKVLSLHSKEDDYALQKSLFEEAVTLLRKAETEEKKLFLLNTQKNSSDNTEFDVAPAPILVSRTHNSMIFKPAPFASSEKVSWYRIFGRSATGSILKVRLKDFHLQGTGREVPAFEDCSLEVKGLEPNEKYIFAVAAYSKDGKIIGKGIGQTTKPILAYHPLSIFTTWTYLCQTAYQLGHYSVAKAAFSVLWDHFVSEASPPPPDPWNTLNKTEWYITQKRLNNFALSLASPILLQNFLGNIFIESDINCKEGATFCDSVCDGGPLYNGQLGRLVKCERMLVAIDLAGWINDANQALQAVAHCYGLLAPIIFHRISSVPVVQVLTKCLCVLQDVGVLKLRKQCGVTESVQHMISCLTYYLAKALRCWKENDLAVEVAAIGKQILLSTLHITTVEPKALGNVEDVGPVKELNNKLENTAVREKLAIHNSLEQRVKAMNEGLTNLMKEVKAEELTEIGSSTALFIAVSFGSINGAYRKVMQLKGQDRFLEFFVILMHRLIREENFKPVSRWANEVVAYIKRRNRSLLGIKKSEKKASKLLKNTVVVVEYHNTPMPKKTRKDKLKLKELLDDILNNPVLKMDPSAQRKQKDRLEKKAREIFRTQLRPLVHNYLQRKRFSQFCMNEMPWHSQLHMLLGIMHFNSFMKCYEEEGWKSKTISRYSFLDPDIFTLHNSGALLVDTERGDSETSFEFQLYTDRTKEESSDLTSGDSISESSESELSMSAIQMKEESVLTSEEAGMPSSSTNFIIDQLSKAFLHFRRAVVLAHRGGHWTILQNACQLLWNCAHIAMMYNTGMDSAKEGVLSSDNVKLILCLPFNLAAQNLLDMILHLQNSSNFVQFIDSDGIFNVPSCVRPLSNDKGGFNLTFEHPFDDVNIVDLHWVVAVVLYTLELLCNQQKWESLVHLAIYFNIVTHERYTQKVTPLLVYAQGQLQTRIRENNGPPPPQPHFVKAALDSGNNINCRNFIEHQLTVATSVQPEGMGDPDLKDAGSGGKRANALISVPVDVMDTFRCFRETFFNASYVSSALRHSRKLHALLLAYTQQRRRDILRQRSGKVDFSSTPTHIEHSMPTDLTNEDFRLFVNVLSKPLPWSQVSLVILSYDNTIELLRANGQNSLCAQALHEQGNLHFYKAGKRHAFRCWSQAIDMALNVTDFINNWQDMESSSISFKHSKDFSEALLSRAGVWGCLLAGVLTAKIAQFITLSDFKFKINCCILSSFFFKGLFRASFPHPRTDREYASYEIGFDCDVLELIPGVDLFSDRFRADIRTVVGSLNFLLHELHAARQNLLMRALADLGLFAEAFAEHHVLINGEKIPHFLLGGFRPSEPKVQMKFDQSNHLLSDNLQVLEEVLKTPLSPALCTLYGPWLEHKLQLGQTHLIIKLAETINDIPESVISVCPSTDERKFVGGRMIIDLDTEDVRVFSHLSKIYGATQECHQSTETPGLHTLRKHMTLPQVKDVILKEAQNKLNIFMDNLKANHGSEFASFPPAALEMVIDAKLQSAAIAFQRLQLAFSAAIALSALQLLRRARVLMKHRQDRRTDSAPGLRNALKVTQNENHINKDLYQETWNMEARVRLHMGLWLKCRLAMVTALTAQIYSTGLKKECFLDTSLLCEEGIKEAKDYGDVETQAEFMLQEVLLDFQLGHIKDHRTYLQNIVDLLTQRQFNSSSAHLVLVKAMLQLTDLNTVEWICTVESAVMQEKMNICLSVQTLILDQLVLLGETAKHKSDGDIYSCLAVPLKNIYLPHIILIAKIKLQLGNIAAQLATCSATRRESMWQEALSTYSTGLELCREAVSREPDLEADFLFQKGKVLRQLTEICSGKSLEAANFLIEAINVSLFHGQNTWLIRQAYLELVLLYFHLSDEDDKETENSLRHNQLDNKLVVKSGLLLVPKQTKRKITGQGRLKEILQVILKQPSKCKILAWVAIRAANQANCILHSSKKLTRDNSVREEDMVNIVQNELHEFILLDILASHQDYQTENDELLPSLTTIQGEKVEEEEKKEASETTEAAEIMAPYRKAAKKLTSIHLLRYNDHLRRLYNNNLLSVQSENENAEPLACVTHSSEPKMHEDGAEALVEVVPQSVSDFTDVEEAAPGASDAIDDPNRLTNLWKHVLNSAREGIQTPVFNTGILKRLKQIHPFLIRHLPEYRTYCSIENIPIILYELFDRSFRGSDFQPEIYTSVFGEYTLTTPESSYFGKITPQDSMAVKTTDKELHVQWYLPPLGVSSTSCETQKVLFLYAYNIKAITLISIKTSTLTNAFCGYKWVYLKRLVLLHKKLSALRSKTDMYLQPEFKTPLMQFGVHRLGQRYTQTESGLNIRKLPTQIEEMVINLCREIKELFLPGSVIKLEAEVPFDITTKTLEELENLFNPLAGYVLKHGSLFTWLTSFIESD